MFLFPHDILCQKLQSEYIRIRFRKSQAGYEILEGVHCIAFFFHSSFIYISCPYQSRCLIITNLGRLKKW